MGGVLQFPQLGQYTDMVKLVAPKFIVRESYAWIYILEMFSNIYKTMTNFINENAVITLK